MIEARAYNPELGTFVSTFDGADLDATLLLLQELNFVEAQDPRFIATVEAVGAKLRRGDLLLRYDVEDDFGHMTTGVHDLRLLVRRCTRRDRTARRG